MSKITVNDVNKMMGVSPTDKVKVLFDTSDGDKITVEVKPYISIQDMSDIIDITVNSCFTSEGFAPEYKDVVFAWKVMDIMTDLPRFTTKEKTVDLVRTYEFITKLDFIERITDADSRIRNLIYDLQNMIDEKLEFQKSIICHPDRNGEVVESIIGLINKVSEIVTQYASKMDGVDLATLAPAIVELSKNKLDKDAIQTILEVGGVSKAVPTLEVVK